MKYFEGIDVWEGKIEEPVPVKVLNDIANSPDPVKTPLGYLALAGSCFRGAPNISAIYLAYTVKSAL